MVNIRSECYKILRVLSDHAAASWHTGGILGRRPLSGEIASLLDELLPGYEKIVFVDTETTGLDPEKDRIIQLSGISVDIRETFLCPYDAFICLPFGEHLSEKITELTGITQRQLTTYGFREKDVLQGFSEMICADHVLIAGHNLQFDLNFLISALKREKEENILSMLGAADYLDTLTVYKDRRPSPHGLSCAIQEYGMPVLNSHNALCDAGSALSLTCMMGYELGDLSRYINRFGVDPRYGLYGNEIKKVTYFPQDGSQPPASRKPRRKSR